VAAGVEEGDEGEAVGALIEAQAAVVRRHDRGEKQQRLEFYVKAKQSARELRRGGKWCGVAGGGALPFIRAGDVGEAVAREVTTDV
jgi:hypothetical protein